MASRSTTNRGALVDSKGNRVPSISTILRKFQDPTNLLNWAWRMGAEGTSLDDARKAGNTLGHLTAALAIQSLGGAAVDLSLWDTESMVAAERPVALFLRWVEEHGVTGGAWDIPGVDDTLGFGGLVSFCIIEGRRAVLSLKAGKGVYLEDILTVAAQAHLAQTQSAVVIRFGKDSGGFDECRVLGPDELGAAWRVFEALVIAYKCLKPVEAIVAGKVAA